MSLQSQDNSGVFDFGTGISTSYNDLANLIIRLTNSKSKIKYVKNPLKHYQTHTQANFPYLAPKYTLESALKEMIQDRKVNWRS
jgi:nucleoside-diphosphate-sugar epimerase